MLYNCVLGGVREGKEVLLLSRVTKEKYFDAAEPDLGENEARRAK